MADKFPIRLPNSVEGDIFMPSSSAALVLINQFEMDIEDFFNDGQQAGKYPGQWEILANIAFFVLAE